MGEGEGRDRSRFIEIEMTDHFLRGSLPSVVVYSHSSTVKKRKKRLPNADAPQQLEEMLCISL